MPVHCGNCDTRTLRRRNAELLYVKAFGTHTVGTTGIDKG